MVQSPNFRTEAQTHVLNVYSQTELRGPNQERKKKVHHLNMRSVAAVMHVLAAIPPEAVSGGAS